MWRGEHAGFEQKFHKKFEPCQRCMRNYFLSESLRIDCNCGRARKDYAHVMLIYLGVCVSYQLFQCKEWHAFWSLGAIFQKETRYLTHSLRGSSREPFFYSNEFVKQVLVLASITSKTSSALRFKFFVPPLRLRTFSSSVQPGLASLSSSSLLLCVLFFFARALFCIQMSLSNKYLCSQA